MPRPARSSTRFLLRERPDIVHFHNIYHQLTPAVIGVAKRFGCKTVLTAHDYKNRLSFVHHAARWSCLRRVSDRVSDQRFSSPLPAGRYFQKSAAIVGSLLAEVRQKNYAMLDCIIAPSEFMRQTLLRKLPDARIEVIVNGIDANSTMPGETAGDYFSLYWPSEPGKRRTDAGAGAAKMREAMPLKIVGDGPLGADLRARFSGPQFLGYMKHGEELNNLIRGARAVVVPSEYYENCSMSVLEAMAFWPPGDRRQYWRYPGTDP